VLASPSSVGNSIARITGDSNRHLAVIYTLCGSQLAVDASDKLVVWAIGTKATAPGPSVPSLTKRKELRGKRRSPVSVPSKGSRAVEVHHRSGWEGGS
jgi:hypothetical protein